MQTHRELVTTPNGLDLDTLPKPLDWPTLFGNDNPVEIEIGSGKGTFLTDQARSRPHVNVLGIEWARWFWRYTSDRLRRHGLTNAYAVRAEAGYFLDEHVPPASVRVLHVYFPDPWPKARHHRRRLIQPSFLPKVERILLPGGQLRVVTDHAGYWEQIVTTLTDGPLKVAPFATPQTAGQGELVGTNFERKYRREGRPFHAIAAGKGEGPGA